MSARPGRLRTALRRPLLRAAWRGVLWTAALTVCAAVALLGVAAARGYRPVVVLTGSMGATAPPGSLAIAGPADRVDLGDVLVMRTAGRATVTHRVVDLGTDAAGHPFAITRGDANPDIDPEPYLLGARELTVRWVVPDGGRLLMEIRSPAIGLALSGFVVLVCVAGALKRFGGHEGLYRETLRRFAQAHGDGVAEWAGWLDRGQWEELRRGAHTLLGLARTIGADALGERALALETAAADRDAVAARDTLPPLAALLADVVAQVEAALEPPPAWLLSEPAGLAADEPGFDAAAGLQTLRELLSASDSQALEWWQAHHGALRAALPPSHARRLAQAIKAMDFDAALAAIPGVPA